MSSFLLIACFGYCTLTLQGEIEFAFPLSESEHITGAAIVDMSPAEITVSYLHIVTRNLVTLKGFCRFL